MNVCGACIITITVRTAVLLLTTDTKNLCECRPPQYVCIPLSHLFQFRLIVRPRTAGQQVVNPHLSRYSTSCCDDLRSDLNSSPPAAAAAIFSPKEVSGWTSCRPLCITIMVIVVRRALVLQLQYSYIYTRYSTRRKEVSVVVGTLEGVVLAAVSVAVNKHLQRWLMMLMMLSCSSYCVEEGGVGCGRYVGDSFFFPYTCSSQREAHRVRLVAESLAWGTRGVKSASVRWGADFTQWRYILYTSHHSSEIARPGLFLFKIQNVEPAAVVPHFLHENCRCSYLKKK